MTYKEMLDTMYGNAVNDYKRILAHPIENAQTRYDAKKSLKKRGVLPTRRTSDIEKAIHALQTEWSFRLQVVYDLLVFLEDNMDEESFKHLKEFVGEIREKD